MKGKVYMKIKKRTRTQILERLYELAHDTQTIKKHIQFDEPEKYITTVNVLNKGETMTETRCRRCGAKYLREPLWSYRYDSTDKVRQHFKCPSCGNENIARDTKEHFEEKRHTLILKTDEGYEFVKFTSYYQFDTSDQWYERDPAHRIVITAAGIFDRKIGFCVATRSAYNRNEYKVLRKLSHDESSILFWLKDFTDSNISDEECRELLEEGKKCYEEIKKASRERSEKRQEKKDEAERLAAEERVRAAERKRQEYEERRLADKRWMYEANPIDIEAMFAHPIMCTLYSAPNGEAATYRVGCAKCGSVEEVVGVEINSEYTCPHCGNRAEHLIPSGSYYHDEANQIAIVFENTDFEENDLLIRVFRYKCEMSAKDGIMQSAYESKRIFAGKEPNIYFKRSDNDRFEKTEDVDKLHVPCDDKIIVLQSEDKIAEIIQNSCLKYSGLLDSWGIGKCKYNWSVKMPNLIYLYAWYANPAIELIMKSNLTHIMDWLVDSPEDMKAGKTLADVLGISPNLVKTIVKMDPKPNMMRDMATLYEADNTLTAEIYEQIAREDLNRSALKNLAERYGLTYDKIMKYLQAAYDHQCILKRETLTVWSDYLRMASAVGVNLNDKAKRFPSSLKKEHDIVMFAYRAVQVEMDKKAFAEQAEVNAKYEFETDDMMVIVPRTPQAVIEEANAQNNCLRSYVERVKRGETIVAFVRRKSEPEKTFLSAEIRDGELIQLKGWCNSDPRTKEIVDFTKEWAKARNITVKC
jgi:predicted RNA-binding Zn-ribbon protein involved in translation (DUF1610 family)